MMGSARQTAIDLQQDIATTRDNTNDVTGKLAGKSPKEIEEICSVPIDGMTLFHSIAANDRVDVLEYILKQGVNMEAVDKTALHVAVSQKAVKTTQLLLEHGANIKIIGPDGKTPLHIAAENGNTLIVRELLEHGGHELLNKAEASGCTPLSLACLSGREDTVKMLVECGAALNFDGGFSPVHAAAMTGNMHIVCMLAEKGASWTKFDRNGVTPLHYAVYRNHRRVVQFLLDKGADPTVKDNRGKTAADLAKTADIKELLEGKQS